MEVKVFEPCGAGGPSEDAAYVDAAKRTAVSVRENPVTLMPLHLASQDLGSGSAQHDHARPRLGLRQHDDSLLETDGLTSKLTQFAQAHESQRRQLGDFTKRRRHRLENQALLLWA